MMMMTHTPILVEIAPGELIDKLVILEIKLRELKIGKAATFTANSIAPKVLRTFCTPQRSRASCGSVNSSAI
jgi:hypothetical protein